MGLLLGGIGQTLPAVAETGPEPRALLEHCDRARGGGVPGIVWTLQMESREGERVAEPQRLEVRAVEDASVAETLEPARFRGGKLLQVGRNMWVTKPGLSKPVPVSPRQRLSGQAANGDVAATNYAADYDAVLERDDVVAGEPCHVLGLSARHKRTTYDRIRYWVSEPRRVAVKAEFYSVSGKLLKTARFDYGQHLEYQGRRVPFVSRMVIRDALQDAETVLSYSQVAVATVPATAFDLGQLQ